MKVFGYDIFEGDKGVIIADNYDSAARIYSNNYTEKITDDHDEYMDGGCYLTELGDAANNILYVNAKW